MAADQPGPPGGGNQYDSPGQRPTQPLGGPPQPSRPWPFYGQPAGDVQPPGLSAPVPGGPPPQARTRRRPS